MNKIDLSLHIRPLTVLEMRLLLFIKNHKNRCQEEILGLFSPHATLADLSANNALEHLIADGYVCRSGGEMILSIREGQL